MGRLWVSQENALHVSYFEFGHTLESPSRNLHEPQRELGAECWPVKVGLNTVVQPAVNLVKLCDCQYLTVLTYKHGHAAQFTCCLLD